MINSINSAIIKLTLWYLAIIMLLSISFSIALYQIYRTQLESDLQRVPGVVRELLDINSYQIFRAEQLNMGLARIQQNLILLNIAMLGVGGFVSYILARRSLQPVAEALEAQTRFTADASHELRTPLTAMQAEIEVALRNKNLTTAETKQLLESNLEEVEKLKTLSEELLTLARLDAKETPMDKIALKKIVNDVIGRLTPVARKKDIVIQQHLDNLSTHGDKHKLSELTSILIDNAIKYSPPKTTIVVTLKRQRKLATLKVSDHGYGIKATDLPHIFDRFYRTDTSRSREKTHGYGLGLSIARQIVDIHAGTIEVKSTPDRGSIFTVKLPLEVS